MLEIKLERIVRALIVKDGKILLCKNLLGGGHYFLPGGHIEDGESPEIALDRELMEEIGQNYTDLKKVAEVRNAYEKGGKKYDEVFYIYLTKLSDYSNIKSKENHLAFEWVSLEDFSKINFKPQKSVKDILDSIKNNNDFWETGTAS
ncbi:MAG: NUDIX domain-containing protein [Parcubacteria group bacterium]|nr:NUDIX domain-containing protein [Parcubacteria group bacterium]